MQNQKLTIGLAGGIGAGKSTVAQEFAKLGCAVISADELNHEVLRRPEVIERIRQWWGPGVLDDLGRVDRSALGQIVFDDPGQLKKLTDLVHPLIVDLQGDLIRAHQDDPRTKAIILDVPLLFEVGQNELCDKVVFVATDEQIRQKRIENRKGWDKKKTKNAENLQFALDTKAKMSDYRVQNNSSIPGLAVQIAKLLSALMQENNP